MNVKTYHTNITGVVGPGTRTRYGKLFGDQAMIPEIDSKVYLWQPDVITDKIKDMNLKHFLPRKSMRDQLIKHTKHRDIESLMYTFSNDPKYGIKHVQQTLNKSDENTLEVKSNGSKSAFVTSRQDS